MRVPSTEPGNGARPNEGKTMSKSRRYDPDYFDETPTDEFIRRRTERRSRTRWDDEFTAHKQNEEPRELSGYRRPPPRRFPPQG